MLGVGTLIVGFTGAVARGNGSLWLHEVIPAASTMTGSGGLLIISSNPSVGLAALPAVLMSGGSVNYAHARKQHLEPLFTLGEGGVYTPPSPAVGIASIPVVSGFGFASGIYSEGSAMLHAVQAIGGDYNYSVGSAQFPAMYGVGIYGNPYVGTLYSFIAAVGTAQPTSDIIVFINNIGQVVDTITAERELIQNILESISADGSFMTIMEFIAHLGSSLSIHGNSPGFIEGRAAVNQDSRVWVVNMDTESSGQYDNYGFNSFFERDGEYFGVADDGIYQLDGDNDDGLDIACLLEIGSSNYGTHKPKKSHGVYVGCSSTGNLYLKVNTDGTERIYKMKSHSTAIQTHEIPVSHRQIGAQWNLTLMNENGCDFDVSDIDFRIKPMTHRSK